MVTCKLREADNEAFAFFHAVKGRCSKQTCVEIYVLWWVIFHHNTIFLIYISPYTTLAEIN